MERREACRTDTQHIVNLSGYVWAAAQLPGLDRMRVLDSACGTGYGSDYLAAQARAVAGIDHAPAVIARCRARYPHPRIAFLLMDGSALGFRSGSFDAAVSQDTLEHVQHDREFVAELARVLRPGGILVLFTPHGKERGRTPEDPYHLREYTFDELQELLAGHFRSIRWFGRRQGARLQAVERHLDAVRRWDPGGLRRLVPRRLRHWIGSQISRVRDGVGLGDIAPADIEYEEGIRGDTNLIAVCVK